MAALSAVLPPSLPAAVLIGLLLTYFFGVTLIGGFLVALALVLVLDFFRTVWATADRANASAYGEVDTHLGYLRTRLAYLQRIGNAPADAGVALSVAGDLLDQVDQFLDTKGAQWTTGNGYVQLWQLLHRIEEALLRADTDVAVARRGLYEERRLVGAEIPQAGEMLAQVRRAVVTLSPDVARYLSQQPPADPQPAAPAIPTTPATPQS